MKMSACEKFLQTFKGIKTAEKAMHEKDCLLTVAHWHHGEAADAAQVECNGQGRGVWGRFLQENGLKTNSVARSLAIHRLPLAMAKKMGVHEAERIGKKMGKAAKEGHPITAQEAVDEIETEKAARKTTPAHDVLVKKVTAILNSSAIKEHTAAMKVGMPIAKFNALVVECNNLLRKMKSSALNMLAVLKATDTKVEAAQPSVKEIVKTLKKQKVLNKKVEAPAFN